MKPGESWTPHHDGKNGAKCPKSGHSPDGFRYRVKTAEDAKKLAEIILEDNGGCLLSGFKFHSIACGDGDRCHQASLRLTKALAAFVSESL